MKKSMVDIWKSGACNVLGAPLITCHDELDFSVPRTQEATEAVEHVHEIMCSCVKLDVPLLVEIELGDSWGKLQRFTL